jgi:hypothetical protein
MGGDNHRQRYPMSALRRLSFVALISCGLVTAAWSGLHRPSVAEAGVHRISKPAARSDVVWIDTSRT